MSTRSDRPPSIQVLEDRLQAIFLERPNKYLARVELGGNVVEAFVPNPGRMRELMVPGRDVLLRPVLENGKRKTRYDLVAVRLGRRFVLIDSGVPNRFLRFLLREGRLPELEGWDLVQPEYKWGQSQFDFLLENGRRQCLLEAKCCTYVVDGVARFPDAPTTRGARHVRELAEARREGYRSVVLFLVQGVGATRFRPNWETDPAFRDVFVDAVRHGVEAYARVIRFRGRRIYLGPPLPVGFE